MRQVVFIYNELLDENKQKLANSVSESPVKEVVPEMEKNSVVKEKPKEEINLNLDDDDDDFFDDFFDQ